MMTLETLGRAIEGTPLTRVKSDVMELAAPCARLVSKRADISSMPLGTSRIGGVPDVPEGFQWPRWKDEPQSFVAQLELAELPETQLALPRGGWLLFFYSARQDTWGFDPADRGSFCVSWVPDGTSLSRLQAPAGLPDGGRFECCAVEVESAVSIPPGESHSVEGLGLSDSEMDAYFDLLETTVGEVTHQVGGFPDQVQGDMTSELTLVTAGLNTGDGSGWEDPRAEGLMKDWWKWRLLLQVASDPAADMMWGDMGYLYFWVEEAALAARDFDRAWTILQCH